MGKLNSLKRCVRTMSLTHRMKREKNQKADIG